VAPGEDFVYRPMSVAEPFAKGKSDRFPLGHLVELAGGKLTAGTLASVDLDARRGKTEEGIQLDWDVLLLAPGAQAREALPGALTFKGPESVDALAELVADAAAGCIRSVAFALPTLAAWPLPLYELALMTQIRVADAGAREVELTLVTPESAPLRVFGTRPSDAMRELLIKRGINLRLRANPVSYRTGVLDLIPGPALEVDRVVSLPVLQGKLIPGLEQDARGFVRTDLYGRVDGRDDLYAAGDITTFPIKQGGIAAQQADAAAASIAALAGAPVEPTPFKPILRGLLLTGLTPRYLRSDLLADETEIDAEPLWWPPAKIVGRYLAPFLADHLGVTENPPPSDAVPVDVELDGSRAWWTVPAP
jgi:sulfide:quinone oxidoreductase